MLKIVLVGGLLIVTGCLVVWHILAVRMRFQNSIMVVHEGMTREEITRILGEPKEVKKPCYASRATCVQDLVYALPFDFGRFWTVSLDGSGRVIDKFYWQSP